MNVYAMKSTVVVLAGLWICSLAACGGGDGETDPCDGVDCSGHGTCRAVDGSATCNCDSGYRAEGLTCVEESGDPCAGATCSGHGTCQVVADAATCDCDSGYRAEGLTCVEEGEDPCEGVTCSGHGNCVEDGGNPSCKCFMGYHPVGLECVSDADPCDGVTCSGHGTCVDDQGTPICECEAGYHPEGLQCISDVDPCEGIDCCGHGNCVDNGGLPTCECESGYHPEGLKCTLDAPAGWPPALDDLYTEGAGCHLPACDADCGSPGADNSGTWTKTMTNTGSDCSDLIQLGDPRAKPGNTTVEEDVTQNPWQGTCEVNDEDQITGTIIDGHLVSCSSSEEDMGIVAFYAETLDWTANGASGTARVILTNVPDFLGPDCSFTMDITFARP